MQPDILFPGLITILSLMFYSFVSLRVGLSRSKLGVKAPATQGHPEFERNFRVQQNTMERLLIFLPSLWLFSYTVDYRWGAGLGALWIVGRILYALGYYKEASKRGAGFGIGYLASHALLLGALVGIIMGIVKLL